MDQERTRLAATVATTTGTARANWVPTTSFASGAPYGDAEMTGTPSSLNSVSTTATVDEVELPDATVFNADLATETTDGTTR